MCLIESVDGRLFGGRLEWVCFPLQWLQRRDILDSALVIYWVFVV